MARQTLASFGETKARLLRLLRDQQSATVADLADALEVTRACVHSHLSDLLDAGLVHLAELERHGRGRPSHVYGLTEAGANCFPNDYVGLAREVLEQLRNVYGEDALLTVLSARNQQLSQTWRQELEGKPLPERLKGLVERLGERGFEAHISKKNGEMCLLLSHCPYLGAAVEHPEICAAEKRLHEEVLGVKTELRQLQGRGICCKYRLLSGEDAANDAVKDAVKEAAPEPVEYA